MKNLRTSSPEFILFISYLLVFGVILLKAFGYIDVSWLVVTAPFWGVFLLVTLWCVFVYALAVIALNQKRRREKKRIQADKDFEYSFFCSGCARPFPEPQKHLKGQDVYHVRCNPKRKL